MSQPLARPLSTNNHRQLNKLVNWSRQGELEINLEWSLASSYPFFYDSKQFDCLVKKKYRNPKLYNFFFWTDTAISFFYWEYVWIDWMSYIPLKSKCCFEALEHFLWSFLRTLCEESYLGYSCPNILLITSNSYRRNGSLFFCDLIIVTLSYQRDKIIQIFP